MESQIDKVSFATDVSGHQVNRWTPHVLIGFPFPAIPVKPSVTSKVDTSNTKVTVLSHAK
jgi:hypothetical protein